RERLDGVHVLFGQVRPAQDVGVDAQGGGEVAAQRRPPEADVQGADTLMPVEAEVVEGEGQLPAVTVAGAARDEVGQHGGNAQVPRRVVHTAGRHQEVQRRRAHVVHALRQQGHAVGQRVLIDRLCHFYTLLHPSKAGWSTWLVSTALYTVLRKRKPSRR